MSKVDLLTKDEATLAKAQGWGLHYVFGLPAKRWALEVLPVQFTEKVGAAQALGFVVQRAGARDPLSTKALRLITEFNQTQRK
jgi:hypothetical protein